MVANRPLLSSCRSVIWCQNYGAETRICENSLSLVKRIKCSGGRNERKFLKFIVGDGMSKQSKFLVLEICPELFVISLPSTAFCSLWQKMLLWCALLLQLPCINQKVMLLCFFSSLCCHHLAECLYPANDFCHSPTVNFDKFSLIFTTMVLNSLDGWKRLHT